MTLGRVITLAWCLTVAGACGTTSGPATGPPARVTADVGAEATTRSTSTTGTRYDTAPPTPAPARRFTLAFTGDLLLHQRVNDTAAANAADDPGIDYDYTSLLAPIAPLVGEVDRAVCHLEVPLSADNTRLRPYPRFRVPGDIARDLAAIGYDACTTASNHVLDQGPEGVAETLGVLDSAGLAHTGSARTATEADQQVWFDLAGVSVAQLSYSYGFNGFTVPVRSPWLANPMTEERILGDAATARRQGAGYVVVSLHWGEEYQRGPSRQQRELGTRLLASGSVDLVVGHHAHVVQPIDRVDGKWLVYGLGNLLSGYTSPIRRDELLVQATVTEQPDGAFATNLRVVPLYLDRPTSVVYPSPADLRPPGLDPDLQAELDASLARVVTVLQAGTGWPDLTFDRPDQSRSPAAPSPDR